MYALTYPSPVAVEIEGSGEGPAEEEEETLLATTESVAVETPEKHETSPPPSSPQHGSSLFMSRPAGVPMISGYSSYQYPAPLAYGGYGRPLPSNPRLPPGYPAFYYQHQHPISPPKYVYYHQGYPMNRYFG